MNILGISCFYHDSAACLLRDGQVIAAAQEERFSRKKHDPAFPAAAAAFCLAQGGLSANELDAVIYYEKPYLKLERAVLTQIAQWPRSLPQFFEMTRTLSSKFRVASIIRKRLGYRGRLLFCRHHESHAASAFYASPFERATVVTVDGVGEWATASIFEGNGNTLTPRREIRFPHSLGLLYSAFTGYLGFDVNEDEYKVMGLAPYGEPRFAELLERDLVRLHDDGSFTLDTRYFAYEYGKRMVDRRRMERLLGVPPRAKQDALEKVHQDLAASVQAVLEKALFGLCREAVRLTGAPKLCMAGGVALNCTANGKLSRESWVEDFYAFPAAGDAGGAVGAAFVAYHQVFEKERRPDAFPTPLLGPAFEQADIDAYLERAGIPYRRFERQALVQHVAGALADQKVVGWFQGKMEFGPRALGNRSILGDPRRAENWPRINQKVKFREDFRPLAPSVLEERAAEFFGAGRPSPYMLLTAPTLTEVLPAVTHVDGSARLQTVAKAQNPLYHELITAFAEKSGVPVVINTSLNTAGMPIVCTPQNAFQCFAESDLDLLVLGSSVIDRKDVPFLQTGPR